MIRSSGGRIAGAAFAVAMVVLAPLWFPLHLVHNARRERRGSRFLRRAALLPAVQLDVADGDLVLRPHGVPGQRPIWSGPSRIPVEDLTASDWWSLDEDGSFAAANAPPTEILVIRTRAGDKIEAHVSWADWNARQRVITLLCARGILPPRPSFDGHRPGRNGLLTAAGFVLTVAVTVAVYLAVTIAKRC